MLSKQVKERIRKNKKYRFQCRKKQVRELYRTVWRIRDNAHNFLNIAARPNKNGLVFDLDKLLAGKTLPSLIPTGFKHLDTVVKEGGGFKRGELFVTGAQSALSPRMNIGALLDTKSELNRPHVDEPAVPNGEILAYENTVRETIQGVKDGTVRSMVLDSHSEFGMRGHLDSEGNFTIDSINVVNKPE